MYKAYHTQIISNKPVTAILMVNMHELKILKRHFFFLQFLKLTIVLVKVLKKNMFYKIKVIFFI